MMRLFIVTFAFLGMAWFELSGGTDFVAGNNGVSVLAPASVVQAEQLAWANSLSDDTHTDRKAEVVARDVPAADMNVVQVAAAAEPVRRVYTAPTTRRVGMVNGMVVPAVIPASMDAAMPAEEAVVMPAVARADIASDSAAAISEAVAEAAVIDYREVTGSAVNLRGGPSTSYDVLTQLLRGEEVEVLDDTGDGWVKLRAVDGDDIGWMSDSFLTASN